MKEPHSDRTAHLYEVQYKFVDGSSKKVNRTDLKRKNNVTVKNVYYLNISVLLKNTFFVC